LKLGSPPLLLELVTMLLRLLRCNCLTCNKLAALPLLNDRSFQFND
jgi:hypothetical protein